MQHVLYLYLKKLLLIGDRDKKDKACKLCRWIYFIILNIFFNCNIIYFYDYWMLIAAVYNWIFSLSCSLKIVNEDIDLKSMNFGEKADDDDEDEAPVVAEIIDDRPVEVKLKELYDSSRWKKMNSFGNFFKQLFSIDCSTVKIVFSF